MVLSSGIDNLTPDVDLNEIYAANINVAYKVMGNSAKNYPTTDKGLLIVTEIDNVILQTYITKKRVYRRYGEIKSYTVYDDSQMQQEIPPKEGEVGADSPVPPVGTIVTSATFTDWLYEIYGYDKDIATETDYGLISETRLKYLINTYAPAYDPTALWALVNTKASQVDLDGKINKAGDTFYNHHVFDYLDTLNGNFHVERRDDSGSYSFYRRAADDSKWMYMMGLNGPGGIDLSIGGGDHVEIHNMTAGTRSYIKSYNNGEGDVAYIEDLGWKVIYDDKQGWTTFTRSGGNIPLQATELLVQFYANIPTDLGDNSYSSREPKSYWYTESNWFSVPLKYGGGGWGIYHFGASGFHATADGITHRGNTGGIVVAQGNIKEPVYLQEYSGDWHEIGYSLDYSRAFIRRVMWR